MPSNSLPDADLNLPEMKTKSPSCPAERVSHGMVWPGEVWHGILYDLAGMAWYMIRSGKVWHGM